MKFCWNGYLSNPAKMSNLQTPNFELKIAKSLELTKIKFLMKIKFNMQLMKVEILQY